MLHIRINDVRIINALLYSIVSSTDNLTSISYAEKLDIVLLGKPASVICLNGDILGVNKN